MNVYSSHPPNLYFSFYRPNIVNLEFRGKKFIIITKGEGVGTVKIVSWKKNVCFAVGKVVILFTRILLALINIGRCR